MPDDSFLYWVLPALPALLNLAVAWIVEVVLSRRQIKPWRAAHAGRMAGIAVFVLAAGWGHASQALSVQSLFASQFPISPVDLLLSAGTILLLYPLQRRLLARRVPQGMESYHQAGMSTPGILRYATIWVFYLLLYESYFRGYLLQGALPGQPIYIIIIYNTILYALAHVNKNVQQVLAAIPFGILLCVVTLCTGHLWFAWVAHLCLALGFELPLLGKVRRLSTVN